MIDAAHDGIMAALREGLPGLRTCWTTARPTP